ncbi:hypothetical protein LINGRAHAP2_LOCUS23536 [Linum grandiflorum]
MGTVFNLNVADYYITSSWGSQSDNRIYVNKLVGERWEAGNVALIGESEKIKELEVSGIFFRGDKLTELSRDFRAWNDRTRCSLRVNCEGSCFVLDYRAGDTGGIRINTLFDWSKHGVKSAKDRHVEYLVSELKCKEEKAIELLSNLDDRTKEVKCCESKLVEAREDVVLCSRRLEKMSRTVAEQDEVLKAMEEEKTNYRAELKAMYLKDVERKKKRIEEMEKEVDGKERKTREYKSKLIEMEDEAARWRKAAERKSKMVEEMGREVEVKEKEVSELRMKMRNVEEKNVKEERDVELEYCKMQLRYKEEELCLSRKLIEWKDELVMLMEAKEKVSAGSEIWIV